MTVEGQTEIDRVADEMLRAPSRMAMTVLRRYEYDHPGSPDLLSVPARGLMRREAEEADRCSGVAAQWCQVHGDCTGSGGCDDPACPLHGNESTHGD